VHDVVAPDREFRVAPPLTWVDASDDVTSAWTWDSERLVQPAAVPLVDLRASARARINQERDARIQAGVEFGGARFDTDERSRANLAAAVTFISAARAEGLQVPETITWRDQADVDHALTPSELVYLGAAMFQHVESVYRGSWALKDAVAAAETAEAVDAVRWPA
jgi:hypothetical protein